MTTRRPLLAVAVAALLVAGAGSQDDPVDLVRQGNAAYARGDLGLAVDLYTRAEGRTNDPGLVAVNKAEALYHLGNVRGAEVLYRCALTDADRPRRLHARLGLANSLVRQARDAASLREAAGLYEACLAEGGLEPDAATDVRHNLELAKLLWRQLLRRPDAPSGEPTAGNDPKSDPPDPTGARPDGPGIGGQGVPDPRGDRLPVPASQGQPQRTEQAPSPGSGNLPPVPDAADLVPLSSDDAAAHLREASARIAQERQAHRRAAGRVSPAGVKDW
jgi:tetratricopeptide (TPR) repeat protein